MTLQELKGQEEKQNFLRRYIPNLEREVQVKTHVPVVSTVEKYSEHSWQISLLKLVS